LQNANFPLDKDDLTIEQWKWVSELKNAIQEYMIKGAKKK